MAGGAGHRHPSRGTRPGGRVELADSAVHAPGAGFGDEDFYPDPPDVDDAEATMLAVAAHDIDEAALAEWLRQRVRFT